jgi:hypothetical protein
VERENYATFRVDSKELKVQFELFSRNFLEHGHRVEDCDLIVCWENDWHDGTVKVLEISKIVMEKFS